MRLPTYLTRRNGVFCFRILIPKHLRPILGRKVIKHTLSTTSPQQAQVKALTLALGYKQAFDHVGGDEVMAPDDDLLKNALRALETGKTRRPPAIE